MPWLVQWIWRHIEFTNLCIYMFGLLLEELKFIKFIICYPFYLYFEGNACIPKHVFLIKNYLLNLETKIRTVIILKFMLR